MKTRKYIILSEIAATADTSGALKNRGPRKRGFKPAAPALSNDIMLESAELTPAEAARISEDPKRTAVRVMPTKLIRPMSSTARPAQTDDPLWGLEAIGAQSSPFDGNGVKVAVLDTGIATHPAFDGVKIVAHDFSKSPSGTHDVDGHGTHCAGTIFGRAVGGQRIGVAPGITQAFIGKVLGDDGSGDTEMLFAGMKWAIERGANIISMSLGFDFPGMIQDLTDDGVPDDLAISQALVMYRINLRAFDTLLAHFRANEGSNGNAIIVAAAGNESRRDIDADIRISASLPSSADGVISVGALDRDKAGFTIAAFSNSDPMVAAPGVGIISAAPGGGLAEMDGTSQAGPHVAGLAALWWQKIRDEGNYLSPTSVREKLLASATRAGLNSTTDLIDCGRGLVMAPK